MGMRLIHAMRDYAGIEPDLLYCLQASRGAAQCCRQHQFGHLFAVQPDLRCRGSSINEEHEDSMKFDSKLIKPPNEAALDEQVKIRRTLSRHSEHNVAGRSDP